MSFHFSANQFENPYTAKRLNNWELPKWYPPRPRLLKGAPKVIANKHGRLDPKIRCCLADKNPWSNFRSTYEFPRKITRTFAKEYHDCLIRIDRWAKFPHKKLDCAVNATVKCTCPTKYAACPTKCQTMRPLLESAKKCNQLAKLKKEKLHKIACEKSKVKINSLKPSKPLDLEYIPGDFTSPRHMHPSRALLLQQKYERDNNIEPDLPLDKLYLGDHLCQFTKPTTQFTNREPLPQSTALATPLLSPSLRELEEKLAARESKTSSELDNMPQHSITEKPNERSPSPIIPAYANFELAKRMHHENLDHQPLPDCVADLAYRKQQITGAHPGLALDIDPIATGVGVKTHNAGPTHCTKLKVFRPSTCGVVPKAYNGDIYRSVNSAQGSKPGAMDLAIQWDYRPNNPADEPQPPPHIDGSGDTAGPAVFQYVKTPRDEPATDLGRSAGVFNSTLGEADFFDKDIMRRKVDFVGRRVDKELDCPCGPEHTLEPPSRARSVSRDYSMPSNRFAKQYQSTPNIATEEAYRAIREKYLGPSTVAPCVPLMPADTGCRRDKKNFFQRARARLCHKVAPEPSMCCHGSGIRVPCKAPPFRVGIPRYNAAGHFISSDSGCSMDAAHNSRVLVVPRPRNPYAKRNYDIDTLVPPFRCFGGGAGEGGYPEHWRLSSVYQHAYKPIEQRRQTLLQTVYK